MTGRKQFTAIDSLWRVWALVVTAANVQDRDIGSRRPGGLRWRFGWVGEVIADAEFRKRFVDGVGRWCGWAVVTTHNAPEGFRIHPRQWVVERTFAWLVKYRRLVRDYEVQAEASEAMI
ncbi:transposase [bacterium]|nr:transposase [bacterium]